METHTIDGISLTLSPPTEFHTQWVGQVYVRKQLEAAWLRLTPEDLPLTPRILGPPGVGKTTLVYTTAKSLGQPVYFMQATMDTRPEDLIIMPVIGDNQQIRYVASPIVSAMITGGTVILDEGNRMAEKSWASLAPLLDQRRYVESQVAGITVPAHKDFRMATTMNADASTFELPEYIISRLQPVIELDYPSAEEEREILKLQVPYVPGEITDRVVTFLQAAHNDARSYTIRSGIQIASYCMKLAKTVEMPLENCFVAAVQQILGEDAMDLL